MTAADRESAVAEVLARVVALGNAWVGFDDSHHWGDALLNAIGPTVLAALDTPPAPGDDERATVWTEPHDHDPDTEPCLPTCPSRAHQPAPPAQADAVAALVRRAWRGGCEEVIDVVVDDKGCRTSAQTLAIVRIVRDTDPPSNLLAAALTLDQDAQADTPTSLAEVDHQLTAYLSDPHDSEWRITQAAAVVREIRAAGGESDG